MTPLLTHLFSWMVRSTINYYVKHPVLPLLSTPHPNQANRVVCQDINIGSYQIKPLSSKLFLGTVGISLLLHLDYQTKTGLDKPRELLIIPERKVWYQREQNTTRLNISISLVCMYFFICSFIVRFLNITQLAPFPFGKCEQGICGAICLTYLLQEKVFVKANK